MFHSFIDYLLSCIKLVFDGSELLFCARTFRRLQGSSQLAGNFSALCKHCGQRADRLLLRYFCGGIRRDLFADERHGIFLTDGALLESLARDKLASMVEQVQAEGWAWVEVIPQWDYSALSAFGRVRSISREATEDERAELDRRYDRLSMQVRAERRDRDNRRY